MTDPLGRESTATVDPATGNVTDTRDANGNHWGYQYSSQGDLTQVTDPLNEVRYLYYNAGYGMVSRISDGSATVWQASYDNAARKLSETDANNKSTYYAWDALDRLSSVTRMLGSQPVVTSFGYDADSNRTSLTDPNNHTWQWTFDPMDRTASETNPVSQSLGYQWDPAGNLQTRTDGLGQQWVFAYDAENRPLTETCKFAGGGTESTVGWSYDPTTHLLTSVADSLFGTTSWTYDSLDRAVSESGPNGALTFTLNAAIDRREGLQAASQGTISYGFDADDNITAISQNGLTTSIAYDGLNRPSLRTLPSGANTTWTYDPHGFVSSVASRLNGSVFDTHSFTRDGVGNITQEAVNGAAWVYGYDDLYRITSSTVFSTNYSWQYDLAGNRTQQIAGGVTTSYTVNNADQLTAVNGVSVSTDANGNVTQDETGGVYSWDVRGRLQSLTRNGVTSLFGYNQDDLRTSQTVNGVQTTYLLDGERVVQEKSSGVATDLLQGPGIDNLLQRGSAWFVPCSLGSTSTVLDGSGNIQQRYYYQPFGQLVMQGSGAPQPYQFTGREADASGLMYYRARYYNPSWGRFVSPDPLLFGGGDNPYAYADNNPVSVGDPGGEDPDDPGWVQGLGNGVGAVLGGLGGVGGVIAGGGAAVLTGPGVVVTAPAAAVGLGAVGAAGGVWAGRTLVSGLYHIVHILPITQPLEAARPTEARASRPSGGRGSRPGQTMPSATPEEQTVGELRGALKGGSKSEFPNGLDGYTLRQVNWLKKFGDTLQLREEAATVAKILSRSEYLR